MKVLDLVRKNLISEVATIYSKNKSSIHEIVKEKEIHANFAVIPQTAKDMATKYKCLVKMEIRY